MANRAELKAAAERAFILEDTNASAIATGLGIPSSTVYRWVQDGKWREKKANLTDEASQKLRDNGKSSQVDEMAEMMQQRDKIIRASIADYVRATKANEVRHSAKSLETLLRLQDQMLGKTGTGQTTEAIQAKFVAAAEDIARESREGPLHAERVIELVRRAAADSKEDA